MENPQAEMLAIVFAVKIALKLDVMKKITSNFNGIFTVNLTIFLSGSVSKYAFLIKSATNFLKNKTCLDIDFLTANIELKFRTKSIYFSMTYIRS